MPESGDPDDPGGSAADADDADARDDAGRTGGPAGDRSAEAGDRPTDERATNTGGSTGADGSTAGDAGDGGPDGHDGGDEREHTGATGREDDPTGGRRGDHRAADDRDGDRPAPERPPQSGSQDPPERRDDGEDHQPSALSAVREVLHTVAIVVAIGLVLFGLSGVWPPMVAVESGSMEPHMFKGDLVFVADNGRYAPDGAPAGVVTERRGERTGYWSFGDHGNVIVYQPHTETLTGEFRAEGGSPIIHRARLYVEEGERWVQRADPQYTGGRTCDDLRTCPAPHDGFITRGDANARYDQVAGRSTVVKPEWIRGTAKVRVPWLGCIRLQFTGNACI